MKLDATLPASWQTVPINHHTLSPLRILAAPACLAYLTGIHQELSNVVLTKELYCLTSECLVAPIPLPKGQGRAGCTLGKQPHLQSNLSYGKPIFHLGLGAGSTIGPLSLRKNYFVVN